MVVIHCGAGYITQGFTWQKDFDESCVFYNPHGVAVLSYLKKFPKIKITAEGIPIEELREKGIDTSKIDKSYLYS